MSEQQQASGSGAPADASPATASAAPTARASETAVAAGQGSAAKIGWLLPVLSLLWLAGKLWASRGQIQTSGGGTIALATAADALPGVVQATLVAGIGLALLVATTIVRSAGRWPRRVSIAVAGALAGGASGGLVVAAYPHLPSIGAIAAALVAAGLIGGILVTIDRIGTAVAGGLAAILAALVVITFLNSNSVLSRMLRWFGAGDSAASYVHASKLVQFTDYIVVGIVAGLIACWYLRRAGQRMFPTYLLGGALPGLLLVVAFGLTSIGGHHLLAAANALSEADRIVNGLQSSEAVPNALIVLFIGAFTALIAFGRTLKRAPRAASARPPAQPERS